MPDNCIRISIDDIPLLVQPDGIVWDRVINAKAGQGAPIYGRYWTCRLSNGVTQAVSHGVMFELMDGEVHTARLPHPATGTMTLYSNVYVDKVASRFVLKSGVLAVAGLDMLLSRISVTL
jgi:hypothetical protein